MTRDEELALIANQHGGVLRPEDVVAFAKNPKCALHGAFTWDDGEAAHQYRLWQAREVIAVSVTVIQGVNEPVRVWVSVDSDRVQPGGGYRDIRMVYRDPKRHAELLERALRDFQSWRQKYRTLVELEPIFCAAERVMPPKQRKRA